MSLGRVVSTGIDGAELINKAKDYFEPQLTSLGLSKIQIESQDLEQLNQSLERVNDAIDHPESFGVFKVKISGTGGAIIAQSSSEAQFEIGVLPILLERKRLIIERIRLLKGEERIENISDLIKSVPEDNIREKLKKELEELKTESIKLHLQASDVERKQKEEQDEINAQERLIRLEMERSERKAKIIQSFLERESVATIVGGFLLIIITFSQLGAALFRVPMTEIINNGFLLLLGYFFGQAVNKTKLSNEFSDGNNDKKN